MFVHTGTSGKVRTHEACVPRAEMPPIHKILHDEYVRDHTLVIAKGEASDGGEYGTAEGEVVVKESSNASWTISICITCPVWMYMENPSVRDVLTEGGGGLRICLCC